MTIKQDCNTAHKYATNQGKRKKDAAIKKKYKSYKAAL